MAAIKGVTAQHRGQSITALHDDAASACEHGSCGRDNGQGAGSGWCHEINQAAVRALVEQSWC